MSDQPVLHPPISNWPEVERALLTLHANEIQTATVSAVYNAQIVELQEARTEALAPLYAEHRLILEAVETFVVSQRATISPRANAKSRRLSTGAVVGFRMGPPRLVLSSPEDAVIRALKARGQHDCIVTRESLDRAAVRALPQSELAVVGARVERSEEIYVKFPGVS